MKNKINMILFIEQIVRQDNGFYFSLFIRLIEKFNFHVYLL